MTASPTAPVRTSRFDGARTRALPGVLLAFRCVVAVLFVLHPLDTSGLLGNPGPGGVMPAVFIVEIALVALVALGLHARIAAFLLSGIMAFAYFIIHLPQGWNWLENGGEPAALYSWIFLLLSVLGPGPLSLGRRGRRTEGT